MITVIGMWEPGYSQEQNFLEDTIWKQTLSAFAVDRFLMVTASTMMENLNSAIGDRVFMCYGSEGTETLKNFKHPQDAVYLFGIPGDNLRQYIKTDDYKVHIETPNDVDMLACSCVAAVLYDRSLG